MTEGSVNGKNAAFARAHSEDAFNEEVNLAQRGLSKRELLAAMAMQGLLSKPIVFLTLSSEKSAAKPFRDDMAATAVLHADALLEELAK